MFDPVSPCQLAQCLQKTNSAGDALKTVAAIVSIPLALITFLLGYRQRERERTRSYYQKVVVDSLFQDILDFFSSQAEPIVTAGREGLKGLASNRKTLPRSCSLALSDFSTKLFALQDKITERTAIFDERITSEVQGDFEAVQDEITGWFNDASLHKRRELDELPQLLKSGQRTIVKRLYRGEFRDF
jgi:hypothetical protein